MEEWKSCVESYEVSNKGNVRRRLKTGRYRDIQCSLSNTGEGYKYFQLQREGRKNYYVHCLVAEYFIGPRPEGLIIDHIDRNSTNNCVENLRYTTQRENCHNTSKFHADIPIDTPNRHLVVQKKIRDAHKDEVNARRREKVTCDKCKKDYVRGYIVSHTAKCDGSGNLSHRSGRKKGDTTCINNLGK